MFQKVFLQLSLSFQYQNSQYFNHKMLQSRKENFLINLAQT
ncbi:unnamed protein product [Paramecium octaurelia]|uniref:Uncharacterized protein n=1 Tax=Paramecium octaurelia TaxID=43137 RepID=A0A8S1U4D6_PAROT|nr:unnamed protein product [Paramecium octaurelia]